MKKEERERKKQEIRAERKGNTEKQHLVKSKKK